MMLKDLDAQVFGGSSSRSSYGPFVELPHGIHVSPSLFLHYHLMASHITVWEDSDYVISPIGSTSPSIASVDSILSDASKIFPSVNGTPRTAESQIKCTDPQAIEPIGHRQSVGTYTRAGASASGDPFIRHPNYYFRDGNITFLVRDVHVDTTPDLVDMPRVDRGNTLLHSSILLLSRLGIFLHPIFPT